MRSTTTPHIARSYVRTSDTLLVMDLQLLRTAQPDGKLAYGRDSTGRPVALLPACA